MTIEMTEGQTGTPAMKFLLPVIRWYLFSFFWTTSPVYSQAPGIVWSKAYGGSLIDEGRGGIPLADGTFIIAGSASSFNGQVSSNHSMDSTYDYWVVKLDALGAVTGKKCFGGTGDDRCEALLQRADGSFVLAGRSNSSDGDVSGNHGDKDIWVAYLSADLILDSARSYGGSRNDDCYFLDATIDGGFLLTGWTKSNDGDVTGQHGSNTTDLWILKIGGENNFMKCIGGTKDEVGRSGIQTSDLGYIIGGYTYSSNGDVSGFHGGDGDMYVVKLDCTGDIQWSRCYGGSQAERLNVLIPVSTGGYLLCGYTQSTDGDALSNSDDVFGNAWLVRIDNGGNILWEKTYGGSYLESVEDMVEMPDGSFAGIAYSGSKDGNIHNHFPDAGAPESAWDCWLFAVDASGNLIWEGCYGGNLHELPNDIDIMPDGKWFISGASASVDGHVKNNHGLKDFWAMKTSSLICSKPLNLRTASAGSNSAILKWDPVPGARKYSLRLRQEGSPWSYSETTDLSWQADNLSPITSYQWQVKALCDSSANEESPWSKKKTFSTPMKLWDEHDKAQSFEPYPNPFSSSIYMKPLTQEPELAEVQILSLNGVVLSIIQWNQCELLEINTGHLSQGIYFLVVQSPSGTKMFKMIGR